MSNWTQPLVSLCLTPPAQTEGAPVALSGTIQGTLPGATLQLSIDWGDNSAVQVVSLGSATSFRNITHTYADNAPASTGDGEVPPHYSIHAVVMDDDGGSGDAFTSAEIHNVPPQLTGVQITPIVARNGTATLTGGIIDPGTKDSHSLIVDWGDGTPPQTFHYGAGVVTFSETHQYQVAAGTYPVKLALSDKDKFTLDFNDFTTATALTLSGTAATATTTDGTILQLTRALGSEAGSAFTTVPIDASRGFSTDFVFRIPGAGGISDGTGQVGGDGFTFTVQTQTNSPNAGGGSLGYGGITPSVAVEFDTFMNNDEVTQDISSNHLGVDVNGSLQSVFAVDVPDLRFDSGQLVHAWINYDDATKMLEVRISSTDVRPTTPVLRYHIDIPNILGQTKAFVGFTAAIGAADGEHDIVSWHFSDTFIDQDTAQAAVQVITTPSAAFSLTNIGPVKEGDAVTLAFTGQAEPGFEQPPTFLYSYDFNNDGIFDVVDSTSASVTVPPQFLIAGRQNVVVGRIKDPFGGFADFPLNISVQNVAPVLSVPPETFVGVGDTVTIRGSFTDPGVDTWRLQVNLHDGRGPVDLAYGPDKTFQVTLSYAAEQTTPITFSVFDSHDGKDSATTIVFVLPAQPLGRPATAYTNQGVATAMIPGQITATLIEPDKVVPPAVILVAVLPNTVATGTTFQTVNSTSGTTVLKTFDVRAVNISPNAVVVVTFDVQVPPNLFFLLNEIDANPNADLSFLNSTPLQLTYLDPITGTRQFVQGSKIISPSSSIRHVPGTTMLQITVVFDLTSAPTTAQMFHTVFTFAGPAQSGTSTTPDVSGLLHGLGQNNIVSNSPILPTPTIPTTGFLDGGDSRLSVSSGTSLTPSSGSASTDDPHGETVTRVLQWMNDIHRASWGASTPRPTTSATPASQDSDPPGNGQATPPENENDQAAAPHAIEEYFAEVGRAADSMFATDWAVALDESVPTEQEMFGAIAQSGIPATTPGDDALGLCWAAVPLALGGLTAEPKASPPRRRKKPRPR